VGVAIGAFFAAHRGVSAQQFRNRRDQIGMQHGRISWGMIFSENRRPLFGIMPYTML